MFSKLGWRKRHLTTTADQGKVRCGIHIQRGEVLIFERERFVPINLRTRYLSKHNQSYDKKLTIGVSVSWVDGGGGVDSG